MTKESALDRLPPQHRRFAEEYVVDFNGRQAAIRAGYSESSASSVASKLTSRPDIQAAIRELLEEPRHQRALAHLEAMAFSNIGDYLQIEGNSVNIIVPSNLSPEKAAAIKKYEVRETTDKMGRRVRRVRIVMRHKEKVGALIKLGKIHGLFPG